MYQESHDPNPTRMKPFKKKQYILKRCKKCEFYLTNQQIYYNYGICPYCHAISGCTICDYQNVVVEYTYWTFWKWLFGKGERTLIKTL